MPQVCQELLNIAVARIMEGRPYTEDPGSRPSNPCDVKPEEIGHREVQKKIDMVSATQQGTGQIKAVMLHRLGQKTRETSQQELKSHVMHV
jgi:hypothetical protein